ncbi:MAG: alanine racemase [Thermodesulfovibrionales bacterium]
MHRGAVAEIDLDAISHNLGIVRETTGDQPVIAVVKADAYGHGAIEVSKRLEEEGVYSLAVSYTDEAIKLRDAGIKSRVLVLFDKQSLSDFFDYSLIPVIHDFQTAVRLSSEAKRRNCKIDIHIKVDTGMGRLGFIGAKAIEDIAAISKMDHINVAGLMSHLSDPDTVEEQLKRFNTIRETMPHKGDLLCHIANSAAVVSFRDTYMDAVRPGIMLYGYSPVRQPLRPAMTVKTKILSLRRLPEGSPISYGGSFITRRESLVAVLPVGYADGYSRAFSNNADVLVRGKRVPVVGRVCMDLTMVDVTGIEGVAEGDEVVLLGRQGDKEITVGELAMKAGTIPYEIMTSLGNRSRRTYVGAKGR